MNSKTIKVALAFVAVLALGMAQDPAAGPPKKVAKDQAEADLINSIAQEKDFAKQVTLLDKWTKDYPDTQFSDERDAQYLMAYNQSKKPREAFDKAVQILGKHPDDFNALYWVMVYVPFLNNGVPSASDLDTAEKASSHILNDADKIFADANKPAAMSAGDWSKLKDATLRPLAQNTLGYIYFQRKDNARATTELTKALQMDPTQGLTSYRLAQALFAQQKEDITKLVPAIFEYARAAVYDGANSLPAQLRQQILGTVTKYYNSYHGSNDGFPAVLAAAKTSALPPADFTIKSTVDLAKDKDAAEEAARKAMGPMMTMWKETLKTPLTGADGDNFFNSTVKDALLPGTAVPGVTKFKGKLISSKPERNPKEIVVAVENPTVADCTLKLEEGTFLPGTMEPGGDIEFEGTAKSFTKEPFMLTFEVTKEQVVGWTGKAAPGAKKGPATAKKKAQ